MNPFALVVVRNLDADEAGDYRIVPRWKTWLLAPWRDGWVVCPNMTPEDLD